VTPQRVLISGASIAGPTLAFWLHRYGWETTVIERAPELRQGGQNIDVRGAGREVARRMDLEETIRSAHTGELGTRFVGRDGGTVAEFRATKSQTDGATAELEILRGDLARLLVEATTDDTEYIFGDHITGLNDTGEQVVVTFAPGREREFDLVIAADGIGSSTRNLVFGNEAVIHPLGLYTGWFTIPRTADDDDWWRWYNAAGGRTVTLRPDNHGTMRAALSFMSKERNYERQEPDEQIELLTRIFDGAGWQTDRLLTEMPGAADFYFEGVAQVYMDRWSEGRIGVVGDAAYCASPVSGMGTSLALTGAYVLAGELAGHEHHEDAFREYERLMRPYVEQAQHLPPGVPGVANPRTRVGVAAFRTVLRLAALPAVSRLTAGIFSPPADKIDLPDYGELVAKPGSES
jgi:2-polyprenyl-6-methoxyphenol hydroxylase-like FAD-dependent oxidoreductase